MGVTLTAEALTLLLAGDLAADLTADLTADLMADLTYDFLALT